MKCIWFQQGGTGKHTDRKGGAGHNDAGAEGRRDGGGRARIYMYIYIYT